MREVSTGSDGVVGGPEDSQIDQAPQPDKRVQPVMRQVQPRQSCTVHCMCTVSENTCYIFSSFSLSLLNMHCTLKYFRRRGIDKKNEKDANK